MNILFLDYDGVVNTPMWDHEDDVWKCRYGKPESVQVNNRQAVQWISEFCEKYGYSIVVTSTWRLWPDYDMALYWGGLRGRIKVVGKTPYLEGKKREDEIAAYLAEHPEVTGYLVVDDELITGPFINRFVKCDPTVGFGMNEFYASVTLHQKYNEGGEADGATKKDASRLPLV